MAETATVPVAGTWYRHVPAGAAPMPGRPAPDGRWQRGEQVPGLYLAQDQDTVWGRVVPRAGRARLPPDSRLPRDLWRFRVALEQVADVSAPTSLRQLGLPDILPDRSQWPAFRNAGARFAQEGFQAVLFGSSARPAGLCLCVFGAREGFAGVTPIGSPERTSAAPPPPRGMRT